MHLIDVLQNKAETGKKPIVVGGDAESGEVAEFLAAQGKEVTLVAKYNQVAQEAVISDQSLLIQKLFGYRVNIIFRNALTEVTPDGVLLKDVSGLKIEVKGDSVVLGWGYDPNYDLYLKAKDLVKEIYLTGDVYKPRRLREPSWKVFRLGSPFE